MVTLVRARRAGAVGVDPTHAARIHYRLLRAGARSRAFARRQRPGPLAQLAEQGTFNPKVAGSRPARPTTYAPIV